MKQFMGVRFEEALDSKTKELVLLAASAVAGCGPWTQAHFAGAKSKGASAEELQHTIALAMMVRAAAVKNFVKGVVPEFSAEDARVWESRVRRLATLVVDADVWTLTNIRELGGSA